MSTNMPETKILSIPVPPAMDAFIHERIATQGFHTVSEYVRALIRADQQRAAREQLDEEAWNKALAEGRALSVEDTLAMVLK